MPTQERRKQQRRTKREERKAIKLHSTVVVGHRMPLPEPPDFGPARWTPEEQAANPGKPMTRLIKDVLRKGRWKEGFDEIGRPIFGDYNEAELNIILRNAVAMMGAGHAINFGKSHGDEQLIIPTDELISPVDDVRLANDVIWVSTYVTPEQAAYLDNPARKVSAGLHRNYVSGNGTVYPGRAMLHIAVTDRPVVDCQGPFLIALSNYVALGTWNEAKHKRDKGKFTSGGGNAPSKAKKKGAEAKKAAAIAGAGLVAGAKIGAAEKAVGAVAKTAGKGLVKGAVKVGKPLAKRAGNLAKAGAKAAGRGAVKVGKAAGRAAGQAAIKAAGAGSKAAGRILVAAGRRGARKLKKLGLRTGKSLAKAAGSGLKTAARQGVKAGGTRAVKVGSKILRTVAKSPLRKAVFRFNNSSLQCAIALANTLQGGVSMDPTILAAINALLAKLGVEAIPDGTPPEQIGPILTGIAMGLGVAPEEEEEEPVDTSTGTVADLTGAAGGAPNPNPVGMSNLLKSIDDRIAAANKPMLDAIAGLSAAISGKNAGEAKTKKDKYIEFRNALGKGGVAEGVLAAKDKIAEKLDWDTDVLEGLHPTIKMSNLVSSSGATEENPADKKDANAPLSDEEIAKRVIARGGKVENIPGYVPKQ